MFRALCAHHQEFKIVLYSIWYHHTCRWPFRVQIETGLITKWALCNELFGRSKISRAGGGVYKHYCMNTADPSGHSLAGIAGSYPARGMAVCRVVCCQVVVSATG